MSAIEVTLAIDYGTARVGTAVSAGFLSRPLEVLPHGSLPSLLDRLLALAAREQATQLVIGLPRNADGSEGEQAEAVRRFARALAAATPLPILLWDEYGSSQAAQQGMIAAGRGRKGRRHRLDAAAAAHFLQTFVDRGPEGAERVAREDEDDERRERDQTDDC